MTDYQNRIHDVFSQAYILGGSPCSGKSTIAGKLSKRFHLQYYNVDDHYTEHLKRSKPDLHPVMYKYANLSWDEIWSQPVPNQVKDEFEFYRELFGMIVQDLQEYDLGKSIIVEGAALLPELVKKSAIDPKKVLYMVPTKEFQILYYSQREFIHHILNECKDPKQAFENWMMRDHLFGKEILRQAERYGFGTILVDGKRNIEEQFKYVCSYFDLA